MRYMTGGQVTVPLVVRTANGGGLGFGAQHSQAVENWAFAVPGLKIAAPSTPSDMVGLMAAAIRSDDPVLVFEHKSLLATKGDPPPPGDHVLPLGAAEVRRPGGDVTLVALASTVPTAMAAAEAGTDGVDAEVIDLRCLIPLDARTVLGSVARTSRLVIEENPYQGGWGGTVASIVAEEGFYDLDAPIRRVAGIRPLPFAANLEQVSPPPTGSRRSSRGPRCRLARCRRRGAPDAGDRPGPVRQTGRAQAPGRSTSQMSATTRCWCGSAPSVSPADWYAMAGFPYVARPQMGLRTPRARLGLDVAGEVVASASGVTRCKAGDEVFGAGSGTLAEYAAVPEDALVAKPANLSFEQAAAVPVASLTALQGLRDGRHPAGAASPDQQGVGRRRHLRGAGRQGVRRRRDRRVQPQERGAGRLARRRPGHRLHPAGLHQDRPPLRPAARCRREQAVVGVPAGARPGATLVLVGAPRAAGCSGRWITSSRSAWPRCGRARRCASSSRRRAPQTWRPWGCSRPGRSPRWWSGATRCATPPRRCATWARARQGKLVVTV